MGISTTAELVRTYAAERGEQTVIHFEGRQITWGELNANATKVANGLLAMGVKPQDRVAILDKNVPEYFELLFGAAKVNAVLVAANWRLAPREVQYIVDNADAKVFLVGQDFTGVLDAIAGDLPSVEKFLILGEHDGYESWAAWRDAQSDVEPDVPSTESDVAFQLYSSGTTGLPKGVMLSNANLYGAMGFYGDMMELTAESTSMVAMPLFHIGGSGWAIAGMYQGAEMHLLREVNPMVVLDTLVTGKVSHAFLVPAVYQFLLTVPDIASRDFSHLRYLAYGASPISVDVLSRSLETFGCKFLQAYGLTETTGTVVALYPEDHDPHGPNAHRLRAAGRAIPGTDIKIVDTATGDEVPTGEVGEIWIRGPQVMVGYWKMPEETTKSIRPDGFFRSGDAGYMDGDGYIYIHDRVKDMIVSGGENIYPAEVENVLMGHPAVADCAVIGVPDDKWGETPKAMVVVKSGTDLGDGFAADVIGYCREHLARFKCPTSVDVIDAIPRNPSGKVLKKDLRAPFWEGRTRNVN
jgi:long-chain acyl-CoA synthetase